jgi:GNAT superfamily N-acetyltransferase
MIAICSCTPVHASYVSALLRELGYEVTAAAAAQRLRQLSETGVDATFLASESDRPLGLIALHRCRMLQYEKPVVRITALVVDRRSRRRGIGRVLIEQALSWADQAGCELVELTSGLDRTEAHAFYRGLGFESNSLRFRKSLGQ